MITLNDIISPTCKAVDAAGLYDCVLTQGEIDARYTDLYTNYHNIYPMDRGEWIEFHQLIAIKKNIYDKELTLDEMSARYQHLVDEYHNNKNFDIPGGAIEMLKLGKLVCNHLRNYYEIR